MTIICRLHSNINSVLIGIMIDMSQWCHPVPQRQVEPETIQLWPKVLAAVQFNVGPILDTNEP